MTLWITLPERGIMISFEQAMRIAELQKEYGGHIHWHANECGCCVTVHCPDCAYVIGPEGEGGYERMEGRGCECAPD